MKNPISTSTTICSCKRFLTPGIIAIFLFFSSGSVAQSSFDEFTPYGNFTPGEDAIKQVDFDKDANAVIIHHLARTDYNDRNGMSTEHRVKIKILNDKGIDNGDIKIPFYSKDDYEEIRGVEAIVKSIDASGQPKITQLETKNIYTVKVNEYYSEVRFAIPNVKAGSIFEYHYFDEKKTYDPDRWNFQASIPTMVNYYRLAIIPKGEFTYKVYKLNEFPIEINNKEPGIISFKMANLPGLRDEAYMDAIGDNLQHVTFQLSAYNNDGIKQKFIPSWDEASRDLLDIPEIGAELNKSLRGTDDFVKTTKTIADPLAKLKAVYNYVQGKMSWNGFYSKYSVEGVKSTWDKGIGNVADINLIFINLLRAVGIEALPLLVNNRDDGKIDINYPFIDQFRKLITYVKLPERNMVIDASDKETPMEMVPLQLLNTYAYKIDKKDFGLMTIEDDKHFYENRIYINAEITPEGIIKGVTNAQSFDYARLPRKQQYKKLDEAKYLETYFSKDYSDLKADSLVVQNIDKDSLPLSQSFRFTQTLNQSGDYEYFDYHMFDNLLKNPFVSDTRFSDINLGSERKYFVSMMVSLPDNYTVDALPKNTSMRTPDTAFYFIRNINNSDGILSMQMKLQINRSYFERDEYAMLQAFYKKLYGLLTEQVVLKKKS